MNLASHTCAGCLVTEAEAQLKVASNLDDDRVITKASTSGVKMQTEAIIKEIRKRKKICVSMVALCMAQAGCQKQARADRHVNVCGGYFAHLRLLGVLANACVASTLPTDLGRQAASHRRPRGSCDALITQQTSVSHRPQLCVFL